MDETTTNVVGILVGILITLVIGGGLIGTLYFCCIRRSRRKLEPMRSSDLERKLTTSTSIAKPPGAASWEGKNERKGSNIFAQDSKGSVNLPSTFTDPSRIASLKASSAVSPPSPAFTTASIVSPITSISNTKPLRPTSTPFQPLSTPGALSTFGDLEESFFSTLRPTQPRDDDLTTVPAVRPQSTVSTLLLSPTTPTRQSLSSSTPRSLFPPSLFPIIEDENITLTRSDLHTPKPSNLMRQVVGGRGSAIPSAPIASAITDLSLDMDDTQSRASNLFSPVSPYKN
ncbi:hypothetical protein BC829DRAFT_491326 [Chytridium lagenaria]|nr:hypothetical protein BC829DRAFT_491326 [Chytridium lagenaria]